MSIEAEFVIQLWKKLDEYLSKYTVGGRKLAVKGPNSFKFKSGKMPDIVIVDEHGVPQLIIEAKRDVEGMPRNEFLTPLGRAPIAQALCYAALALDECNLERTPLFATANKHSLVLFKGIEKSNLNEIVNIEKCKQPKRHPEDWANALEKGGLGKIFKDYIIDSIESPLKQESIEKLFKYVEQWLAKTQISPAEFYRVFVTQLRSSIENLHEYIRDAVKWKILNDKHYFMTLFDEAKKMSYTHGILSKGLLQLTCPENSRKICEYLKEILEKELRGDLTPEKAFKILSERSKESIAKLCNDVKRAMRIDTSSIPICNENKKVEDLLSFDNLTKMMAYVLASKILAYKILELHYRFIPQLRLVHYKEVVKINNQKFEINSPNAVIKMLNYIFNSASLKLEEHLHIKDFSPLFKTPLYDKVILQGGESINRINAIIDLIDSWKDELRHLPGIIGYVYEGLLPPRERHQLGQFYTPPAVARLIVKWAIRSENDRVLDAGCGSGTFLIEGYKRLLDLKFNKNYNDGGYPVCTKESNEHQEVLNQLYGVDINAFATHITSIHLMLMEPKCPISKLNIETRDFFTLRKYENAFGETLEGFDAVIGNPPYTRWVEIPEETKDLIKRQLDEELKRYDLVADVARGKEPGIYIYWIMHAAKNLLKERGRIGMIISNAWLQTDYGVNFGKFLLDNFRIVALIDLSFRLFEAIISTVIILAEKEPDKNVRNNNIVTLIRIPPKIKGVELDLDKTGKILDDALRCVEDAINKDGSIDVTSLERCQKEYGIYFTQVKQSEIPREDKWIKLFFVKVEDLLKNIKNHPHLIKLEDWFEPSRGNSIWSIWALSNGKRPDLGAKEFFYFSNKKINEWVKKVSNFSNAVKRCLTPAITRSPWVKTFTFRRNDWEVLHEANKDVYLFVCHKPRNELPHEIRNYVEWGESDECRTKIRGTRGGGRKCSEAEACEARRDAKWAFYDWYDLGGFVPTPIMAIYQPRYKPQFFLVDDQFVTYHAIITFIPKVHIKYPFEVNPAVLIKEYPALRDLASKVKSDVVLDEKEVKALMAYLNSTFCWLWLEQNARYIPKGPLGLEVSVLREMPLLNVKNLKREDVEELAMLFDNLETKARQLAQGKEEAEENTEDEEGGGKLEMFRHLKPYFQAIDRKIAEVLGISIDFEQLWNSAWEMMERRIKGAKGPTRPGAEVIDVDIGGRSRRRGRTSGTTVTLDKWFKPESS